MACEERERLSRDVQESLDVLAKAGNDVRRPDLERALTIAHTALWKHEKVDHPGCK
jgi:uncharacterized membrane protein